ncbi:hypothetical protein Tco_0295590 [Tanacetum coccineum]
MKDEVFFNQSKYIKEMLKKFGLENSKPTKTPVSMEIKLTKDNKAEYVDSTKYREGKHFYRESCIRSTYMAFGGNTRDLSSFGEEMDEITTIHQSRRRKGHTDPEDGVTITYDSVRTSKRWHQEI